MKSAKASLKFTLYLLCILAMAPVQFVMLIVQNFIFRTDHYMPVIPIVFHGLTRRIFQIRIDVVGKPVKNRQVLFMSNHISYLDIPVLGSLIAAPFLAKKEVASWPLFNILAYLQQTAFIERKTTAIKREAGALDKKLSQGRDFIIFPEGTSSDGRTVWPFKSSLFALAMGEHRKDLCLQPVTITLLEVDGRSPEAQEVRELYAWHLHMDMPLGPHFWRFARGSGARLRITFHEPLESSQFSDRKDLAKACHDRVSKGMAA